MRIMPAAPDSAKVREKWSRVTPQRAQDYEEGVRAPRTSWQQATQAAAAAQAAGIQAAIQNKSFEKGVAKAGDAKWQGKALSKGVNRFGPGVQEGAADYEAGVAPYLSVIGSTSLPPRFAKGDPRNIERVRVMSAALRAAKMKR